jgi:outer membrane immunogenic protein
LAVAATVGILGVASSAQAARADGYQKGPGFAGFAGTNRSGVYYGAALGYAWGDAHLDFSPSGFAVNRGDPSLAGLIGGGHVGVLQQSGSFVYGAEVSVMAGDLGGRTADQFSPTATIGVDPEWVLMLNARLGYASGAWLLYATGGYAGAQIDGDRTNIHANALFRGREWHNGWNLGGGIEWQISPGTTFGLEYRHIEFDNRVHRVDDPGFGDRSFQADASLDTVTARLSFKLGK